MKKLILLGALIASSSVLAASNNVSGKGAGTQVVAIAYPQNGIKGYPIDIFSRHEIYMRNDTDVVQGYQYFVQVCSETDCRTEQVGVNVEPKGVYRRDLQFKHTVAYKNGGVRTIYARTWIEGHLSNYVQEMSTLNIPY